MIRKLLVGLFMVAAMICSFSLEQVKAQDCGFRTDVFDTMWAFQANAGSSQTRSFLVTCTDGPIIFYCSSTGSEAFSFSPNYQDTLQQGDTIRVYITYHPGANSVAGTVSTGTLKVRRVGTDCYQPLALKGMIIGNNSGGGDAVGLFDPRKYNFGKMELHTDTCHDIFFVNKTGKQITITDWHFLRNNGFTVDPEFSQNTTLDSGSTMRFTICYGADSLHPEEMDSLSLTYNITGDSVNHTTYALLYGQTNTKGNNGGGGTTDSTEVLKASPREMSFGPIPADSTSCKTVTVTNLSKTTTAILTGWNQCESKNFSITPAFNGNDTIAPGHSMTFTICYTADKEHASASCNLTMSYITNNPSSDGHKLTVSFVGKRSGDNNTKPEACLRFEQSDGFRDAVVQGASADRFIYLINNTGASITINHDSVGCTDAAAFTINTSMPITIPAHSIDTLRYTFTPFTVNGKTKEHYEACGLFYISGDSITCEKAKASFTGVSTHDGAGHTDDSVVRPLFPNSKESRIVAIQSTGDNPSKTFTFSNNLSVDVTVSGISIDQKGSFFSVQAIHPEALPFVLHPGDQFSATIGFTATDNAVHTAKLKITATHTITDVEYEMQGIHLGTASVKDIPSSVSISMVPNPMSTNMTVTAMGIRTATVEIYDMLGNQLVSSAISSSWNWNGYANGAKVAAGTYIVRFSGVSTEGEAFVTSRRVVVTN